MPLSNVFRFIFFLPNIISIVALIYAFRMQLDSSAGLIYHLLNDMGIKSEKVELPRADMEVVRYPFENSLFKVYNDVKAVYLKDLVDMYSRGNPQDYGFTEEELKVLLKSLKEYAFSLQTIMKQIKNNRDIYNSLFEDTKVSEEPDHYVPLTQSKIQESLFDYLDKQQKRESETKENKNK